MCMEIHYGHTDEPQSHWSDSVMVLNLFSFFLYFLSSILLLDHLTSHMTYRSGAAFTYNDSQVMPW
jgi:hypothetical protein